MPDNANLDKYADSIMGDAIYGMETLDIDTLRATAQDLAFSAADSATTHTSDCYAIINRYETEAGNDVDDLCGGATYSAPDWRDAMTAYAFAIARVIIDRQVGEALQEIDTAADLLADAAAEYGAPDIDEPRISLDCPHGWAPHEKEDNGMLYWTESDLEGCRAVAIQAGGIWLSYTWTPATAT